MKRNNSVGLIDEAIHEQWVDEVDSELPDDIAEGKPQGRLPSRAARIKVMIAFRKLPDSKEVKFRAALTDTLRDVFDRGAVALGESLLPPNSPQPLDILRCRKRGDLGWSEPLTGLERPLWLALVEGCTRHFGIEYVLAIKINTRWGISPAADATPRSLLASFGFDPAEFSLYRSNSADLLPPDTSLTIRRGEMFEAQKDGRYGAPSRLPQPMRGSQSIDDDFEVAQEVGFDARLFTQADQRYIEVRSLAVPSPPWSQDKVNILIAIPATYPMGGLDAFYLERTVTYSNGSIPYEQSIAQLDGRSWGLISWHYAINRPWSSLQDDLLTHIEHCRGFFLRRGVNQ